VAQGVARPEHHRYLRHMVRRLTAAVLLTALLAACSGGDDASTTSVDEAETTLEPTTTAAATTLPLTTAPETTPETMAPALSEWEEFQAPGPYLVGSTTLTLAKGPSVEVWYPVAPVVGVTPADITYDVRDFVPESIRAVLTGDAPATYTFPGVRDGEVADGTFPVVLFSHGFTGMRLQSSFLTSHLASWGMIVVAPDHPSRDLAGVLGGTASGDRADAVDDLLSALELVLADDRLGAHADPEQVAALGHSAGGGTVLAAASDPRIDGYVSMASGAFSAEGTTATLPEKPSFFLAGTVDAVVSVDEVTRPAFDAAPAPSTLWVIDGVGHNGFDDFCTFGNGTGIIGVAEASGLGTLLDAQPKLRALGEDGCIDPAVPVDTTFPIVRHAVTAWLRHLFGVDAQPLGIATVPAGTYPVEVEVAAK